MRQAYTAEPIVKQFPASSVYRKLTAGDIYGGIGTAVERFAERLANGVYRQIAEPWIQGVDLLYELLNRD